MLQYLRLSRHRWVVTLAAGGIITVLALVLFARPSEPARQVVTWMPTTVERTIFAGQSAIISIEFTTSRKLRDVVVTVAPALQPFVAVEPVVVGDLPRDATVSLELVIAISPGEMLSQRVEDTIQLRTQRKRNLSKAYPPVLPVAIDVNPPTITEPSAGLTAEVPRGLSADVSEESISLFDPQAPDYFPYRYVIRIFDVSPDLGLDGLSPEDALMAVAESQLGSDLTAVTGFHDGGVEVTSTTYFEKFFFFYHAETGQAISITGSGDFSAPEFSALIASLEF